MTIPKPKHKPPMPEIKLPKHTLQTEVVPEGYQSPIEVLESKMTFWVDDSVYKAAENVNIHVDREELLKALQYDRGQYDTGYKNGYVDGYAQGVEDIKAKIIKLCGGADGDT